MKEDIMAVKRKGLGKGIDSLIPDTGVAKTKSKSKRNINCLFCWLCSINKCIYYMENSN